MNTKIAKSRNHNKPSRLHEKKHSVSFIHEHRSSYYLKPLMPSEYTFEERKKLRDYEQKILKKFG